MASWLARLSGKSSSEEEEEPATVAHMGGANTMYYDEKRKRWVERGKEDEVDDEEELGPPPMAFTKRETPADIAAATGSNDFMAQMTRPVALGSARSRYVDPFASMGAGPSKSSSSSSSVQKEPPKLLPAPNPFGGLLPGPPVLAEEKPSEGGEEKAVSSPIPPDDDKQGQESIASPSGTKLAESSSSQALDEDRPAEGAPPPPAALFKAPPVEAEEDRSKKAEVGTPQSPLKVTGNVIPAAEASDSPVTLQQSVLPPPPPPSKSHEKFDTPEEPLSSLSNSSTPDGGVEKKQESKIEQEKPKSESEDVWEPPAWGQEPASTPAVDAELDYDGILGDSSWEAEDSGNAVQSSGLREREADVPDSPAVFSSEKAAAAASPLKAPSPAGEDIGWGALLSNDEWGEQEKDWTMVAGGRDDSHSREEEEGPKTAQTPHSPSPSPLPAPAIPLDSRLAAEEKEWELMTEGAASDANASHEKASLEGTDGRPGATPVEAATEQVEVDGVADTGTDAAGKEEQKSVDDESTPLEPVAASGVEAEAAAQPMISVKEPETQKSAEKEEAPASVEDHERSNSIDFFDEILGGDSPKESPEADKVESEPTSADKREDLVQAAELSPIAASPALLIPPPLPPKAPKALSEGIRKSSGSSVGSPEEDSTGEHGSATPRVAEAASIAPTRAPWGREDELHEGGVSRQRSASDIVLLPLAGSGCDGPAKSEINRPPPSPVHSPRVSLDRSYRARIVDHSKRIQSLEERMSEERKAFDDYLKENSDTIAQLQAKLSDMSTALEAQKAANAELHGKVEEQQKRLDEVTEEQRKQKEAVEGVTQQTAELSSTVAAKSIGAAADGEELDPESSIKDLPDFVRTRDREDILAFVQNLLKAKKKQETMYQSRLESGSVYSQRSRSMMARNGRQYLQQLDSSSPASSISRAQRTGSANKRQKPNSSRTYGSASQAYPARSFHRLMEEYDSDDDGLGTGRDNIMRSPAEVSQFDLNDSRLSDVNSNSGLIARLEYLSNHCRYTVPSFASREEAEAAKRTLEEAAASTDAMVGSAFAKTMEVISFSWDSSTLPQSPLISKATLSKAFSCMPGKLDELLKSSTRSPLSVEMQQQVRAMLGAMWNLTLNEDSHDNPILAEGSSLLPSLVQVLARYSIDDRQICKNACGLLLTLMTNDSKLCRDFLAIDGGLSVLTSVLRTHKFEQEDAATEQALQCIFLLATVVPDCRATIGSQIDRFTLDRLQGIRHASRLRDILFRPTKTKAASNR